MREERVQLGHLGVEEVLVRESGSEEEARGPLLHTHLHRLVHSPGTGDGKHHSIYTNRVGVYTHVCFHTV